MSWSEIKEVNEHFFGITRDKGNLLYQYRSMDGFWSIIKGDSFWATNARFSNDDEEQKLGLEKIHQVFIDVSDEDSYSPEKVGDCYIICFCEKDDKLSQWRGYALNGVSMGFDFSNIRPFYVYNEETKKEQKIYNVCGRVGYFNKETVGATVRNWMYLPRSEFRKHKEVWSVRLHKRVPFIKHDGFAEEEEFRFVFENDNMDSFVKYKAGGSVKQPYIVVKMGSMIKSNKPVIRTMFDVHSETGKSWMAIINGVMKKYRGAEIIKCKNESKTSIKKKEKYCDGCIKTRLVNMEGYNENEWTDCPAGNGFCFKHADEIIISDCKRQEELFNELYKAFHESALKIVPKIWCEGHLPLRSVTVSPSRDAELIRENIEHYCKHGSYWLRDVEVKKSRIPYRS